MIPLPKDWKVRRAHVSRWQGVFGRCKHAQRTVVLYVYTWIPRRLRGPIYDLVRDHEAAHARGLEGHGNPFCIMFECPGRLRDTWAEKAIAVMLAPLGRLTRGKWFCRKCRQALRESGAGATEW
jgi:hypothetical protein